MCNPSQPSRLARPPCNDKTLLHNEKKPFSCAAESSLFLTATKSNELISVATKLWHNFGSGGGSRGRSTDATDEANRFRS